MGHAEYKHLRNFPYKGGGARSRIELVFIFCLNKRDPNSIAFVVGMNVQKYIHTVVQCISFHLFIYFKKLDHYLYQF